MFEATKKKRVSQEVSSLIPSEVITGIWRIVSQMRKDKKIMQQNIAFVFADDYEDDKIFVMVIQSFGAVAEEFPIDYSGQKDFLGHGTILIVADKPKTVTLTVSAASHDDETAKKD